MRTPAGPPIRRVPFRGILWSAVTLFSVAFVTTQCGVPGSSSTGGSADVVNVFYRPVASAITAAQGGTLEVTTGTGLSDFKAVIPAGVLTSDVSVSVSAADLPPGASADNENVVGPAFSIEGLAGKLDGDITLVLPYYANRIPGAYDANDVFAAFWDGEQWSVVGRSDLDPANHTVSVETYHASTWAAVTIHPYTITPNAGNDQVVSSGATVRLDATDSVPVRSGRDVTMASSLTYRWWQQTGTPVILDDTTSPTPTFVAPTVTNEMNLRFEVEVASAYAPNNYAKDGVVITVTPRAAPDQASNPIPAQGATEIPRNVVLKWTASESDATHDLYFGTNKSDVQLADRTSAEFQGSLTEARYTPTTLFAANTTVYWRVDEVTSAGTTMGLVWQFTTLPDSPGQAAPTNPADGAVQQPVDTVLSWTPGQHATQHDLYLGTNETLVGQASTQDTPIYLGRQSGAIYVPEEALDHATTYYWRVNAVNAAGVTQGEVYEFTTIEAAAGQASNPTPSSGATGVPTSITLVWLAGSSNATHDVYFGTDSAAITYATTSDPVYKGNQSSASYTPAGLTAGCTYYWRIDEVTEAGATRGDVWSFTTAPPLPGTASAPDPADGAVDVATESWLSWTPGSDASMHEVYLGTDLATVQNAESGDTPIYRGSREGKFFDPSSGGGSGLSSATTYYWRIDEINVTGTTTGTVWTFTTAPGLPQPAHSPSPGSDLTNVPVTTDLSWTAGAYATSHRVYLGTNAVSVRDATTDSVLYKGEQAGTTYDPPGDLQAGTTYYWRIDEVNATGVTKGTVYNFTTN